MHADLQNLPSRGFLPAEGSVAVCSRAPNYVAAHSTEPAQIVQQDDTNPLVRTLRLKKNVGKKRKGSPVSGAKKTGRQARAKASPAGVEANQASANVRTYSRLELGLMSLKGLQDVLRSHGAPVSGRKAELVTRIEDLQKTKAPQEAAAGAAGGGTGGGGSGGATAGAREDPLVLSDDEAEEI